MDVSKTAPFELGDGRDACLLIHGFTGSPWDMRPLGESLAARGYYVRAVRLPGHGTSPEAMEHVTWRDWEQATEDALLSLHNFRQVFVAGLSMGALLSVLLASRHPDRVHGLALLAPAMRFRDRTLKLVELFWPVPFAPLLKPWVEKTSTDIEDESERAEAPVLPRFPTARLYDLLWLQKKARAAVGQVHAPSLIAVAEQDHVVAVEGGRELARMLVNAKVVRFIALKQGYHIMPRDRARSVLQREVAEFFDRLRE